MFKNQSESMIDTYKREIKACESIIVVQKDNKEKFISCIKKLKEEKKAAYQEKGDQDYSKEDLTSSKRRWMAHRHQLKK